jgi:hypothetical protein
MSAPSAFIDTEPISTHHSTRGSPPSLTSIEPSRCITPFPSSTGPKPPQAPTSYQASISRRSSTSWEGLAFTLYFEDAVTDTQRTMPRCTRKPAPTRTVNPAWPKSVNGERAARLRSEGTFPDTGAVESAQVRRACAKKPETTRTAPAISHGSGFRCWSQPEAVAVCQQVVPGPSRCTHAT